jgi:hypothetical protein
VISSSVFLRCMARTPSLQYSLYLFTTYSPASMAAVPPRAQGGALPRRSASVATDSMILGSTLPRDPEPHPDPHLEHITAYGPLHRVPFVPPPVRARSRANSADVSKTSSPSSSIHFGFHLSYDHKVTYSSLATAVQIDLSPCSWCLSLISFECQVCLTRSRGRNTAFAPYLGCTPVGPGRKAL